MAAGLGFKDFTTGEVLTAADVDGYLMQGVWVFASAAARDAAVTSPQEGNFAYLKDTNVTTYYTGSAWANLDTTGMTNPMTTTGDIIYSSSGSTPARLGIGSTGNVLTVSGGVPSWAAPAGAGFVGCFLYKTGNQSIATATQTVLTFENESYDTDGFHSTTSNTGRITIPSGKGGKYLIGGMVAAEESNGTKWILTTINGGSIMAVFNFPVNTTVSGYNSFSNLYNLTAGDYVEVLYEQNHGANRNVYGNTPQDTNFYCIYLGA